MRGSALGLLVAMAALSAGCALTPDKDFENDKEWNRRMTEKDNAVKEMPMTMGQGTPAMGDSWSSLFPGTP